MLSVTENLLNSELKIMDVDGKLLLQRVITTRHLPLATHHFANGIYFVQVVTDKGILAKSVFWHPFAKQTSVRL